MTILMNCPFCSANGFTHAKLAQHLFECDEFNSHRRALRENSATQQSRDLTAGAATNPAGASAEPGAVEEGYNAGEVSAIEKELIGPVERARLLKAPAWVRSIVHGLIKHLANRTSRLRDAEQRAERFEKANAIFKEANEQYRQERAAERERAERVRKDAERYRWLRCDDVPKDDNWDNEVDRRFRVYTESTNEELDAKIDASREGK